MSAIEELIAQYREKKQIPKSRKRARESTQMNYLPQRTTKGKTEDKSNDHVVIDVDATNN